VLCVRAFVCAVRCLCASVYIGVGAFVCVGKQRSSACMYVCVLVTVFMCVCVGVCW